jgi:hypothetical protein
MKIVLTEVLHPEYAVPSSWLPFPDGHDRYSTTWWTDPSRFRRAMGRRWFAAHWGDSEVGRLEVAVKSATAYYVSAAVLGAAPILEIERLEVASADRCRGIGTAIVTKLSTAFPGHRLVASSEQADGFWASLRWKPIPRPQEPHLPTLFAQPR